jgi:hypothetical protein
MEPDPIPVTNFPAPDTTFSAVPYGRIRNFLDGFSFSSPDFGDEDVGAEGGGRYIPGFYPYIVRGVAQPVFDDPDPLAPPPDPPEYLDQIAITTGYIINPAADDASTESFSVPVFEGQPLDSDPAPSVLLSSGSYAAYLITATSEVVIQPAADAAPDEETGYIFKLFDFTVTVTEGSATLSAIQHYVSNDVVIWSSTGGAYHLDNYDESNADSETVGRVLYEENSNDPDDGGKKWTLRNIRGADRVSVNSEGGDINLESADFTIENYSGGTETDGQILESETVNADGGKSWVLRELVAGDNITITNNGGTIEIASTGGSGSGVQTEQAETQVQAATDSINILGTGNTRADDVLEFTAGAGSQTDLGIKSAGSGDEGKVVTHNGTNWTRDYVRLVDL